jgi:hypothetical protein
MINHKVNEILEYKAKGIKTSPEYLRYVEEVLRELEVSDPKEAFILGAIDAIINGPTYLANDRGVFKRSMLKEIIKK